jgi:rubredoxin
MANEFNCSVCGKFFKWDDPDNKYEFIPDSYYSTESSEWICGNCVRKEAKEEAL